MTKTTDLPQIGDKLEIYNIEGKKKSRYVSQLLDSTEPDTFIISGPIKNNSIVPFQIGLEIEVQYFKEGKGRFIFKGIVKKRELNNIYKLEVKATTKISRLQERDFYRLPVTLEVIKTFLPESNKEEIKEKCLTEDISGGGMKLFCNYHHSINDTIQCNFKVDDIEIMVRGKIIRVDKNQNSQYAYNIGVKFIDLTKEEREKIIKFIFTKQVLLRKKGLI